MQLLAYRHGTSFLLGPEAIRDEKVKALQAIKPLVLGEIRRLSSTRRVGPWRESRRLLAEKGIPENSFTETYAALCLHIENYDEGSSVLSAIRKAFGTKASGISVQFKRPPEILFGLDEDFRYLNLVIRIQPNEGITLYLNSKLRIGDASCN